MATTSRAAAMDLAPLLKEPIDWRYKGFPAGPPVALQDVGRQGWNVLDGDFMLPVMLLKQGALRHNLRVMADFCTRNGVSIAPHGKTTMAPQLVEMQFAAGAWAVTAATMWQARVFRAFRAPRIVLANELVEPSAVRWVAGELKRDPSFDFYCLVDSSDGVARLVEGLAAAGFEKRLNVLLEIGFLGGRTGSRTPEQALAVARAVAAAPHLQLAGVESFEGIMHSVPDVDGLLDRMRRVIVEADADRLFGESPEVIVSSGGSAYFDRVVEDLGSDWKLSRPVRVVLRSGCYITHDAVHYTQLSPFGSRLPNTEPLKEALEVWGVVLSRPEPELALLGFGKRDVSYDLELPVPRLVKRASEAVRPLKGAGSVTALNDQHAYMRLEAGEDLAVGDLVGCGISHPCTAFDKWRLLPVVDDGYGVVDAVLTYF
jgi:D-serine dehydratase